MARPVRIPAQQQGFEKSVMDAVNRLNRSGQLKLNVNSRSFTQPLGKITASADEFTKSLEASNARVIAFGASVGIINAVSNAFKSLVIQTMEVQKQMTEINVVMQTGTEGLQKMQTGLFKIAKETAQSFSVVTEAALEFSRQGLSMEKTLLATKQAMILTRITALDAAEAVINNNQPSADTDAFGAQASEDVELVTSALNISAAEIRRAQAHLAEWNAIGDMRVKEINAALAEARGHAEEIQARLSVDLSRYSKYEKQQAKLQADYDKGIQALK